jgi:hypothetical protein
MEVREALSSWWFIGLASIGIGMAMPLLFQGYFLILWIHSLFLSFYFFFLPYYYISFTCVLLTIIPWHGLDQVTGLHPDELRRAGYEVTMGRGSFDVRVAEYSVARIYERDGKRTFRCLPTASGLWAMALLSLVPGLIIAVFPLSLFIYHRCWKGLKEVTEKMRGMPAPEERGVEALMMDSLAEAYVLAREAADDHRAELQDRSIIIVIFALVGWLALLALSGPYPTEWSSFAWKMGLGTLLLVSIALTGIFMIKRWTRELIEGEERWAERLMAAMRGVGPEGESTVELLLRACHEVPRWLEVNHRGSWRKEPGKALLILILLDSGVMAIMSYGSIWWGFYLLGGAFMVIGIILLTDHYRRARKVTIELREHWDLKMAEMESYLDLTRER